MVREETTGLCPASRPAVNRDENGATIDQEIYTRLISAFDQSGRAELCEKVCADIESARNSVAEVAKADDYSALCGGTHILISVAGAIGATKLQKLAQCLNSAGHAADSDQIGIKGPELVAEADNVLDYVRGSLEE